MKSSYYKKGKTVAVNIMNLVSHKDRKKVQDMLKEEHKYDVSVERY